MKQSTCLASAVMITLFSTLLAPACAHAAKIALLVGINKYADQGIKTLEGPVNDVSAIKDVLVSKWNFSPDNIVTLTNSQATQARIVHELERLKTRSAPGDFVFIYFSGHGTSAHDKDGNYPLPYQSGAFVPYDFTVKNYHNEAELKNALIVGRWHMQPNLTPLDKDREVFVVMDSCYSGNAVRSPLIGEEMPGRQLPISVEGDSAISSSRESTLLPYPYRHVVFLSAANDTEIARDIDVLHSEWSFDKKPHGAFTNALIQVLNGNQAADSNGDKQLSYVELAAATRSILSEHYSHSPQLLPMVDEDTGGLTQHAIMGPEKISFLASPTKMDPTVRVIFDSGIDITRFRIAGVVPVQSGASNDFQVIRQGPDKFRLLKTPGDMVGEQMSASTLSTRLRAEAWLRKQLQPLRYTPALRLETDPAETGGNFTDGQSFVFKFKPTQDSYLLLLDMDADGKLTLLYPLNGREAGKIGASTVREIRGNTVTPPFGIDHLIAIALPKPFRMEDLRGLQAVGPDHSAIIKLERLLAQNPDASWTMLDIRTFPKPPVPTPAH